VSSILWWNENAVMFSAVISLRNLEDEGDVVF
jgi:hypothetical protein